MSLMIFHFQPKLHGSVRGQKQLTIPHCGLGSITGNTPSKIIVLVSPTRQGTPQGHQHTGYGTAGVVKVRVSSSLQLQTRFSNTVARPKRQTAGDCLCLHAVQARPSHRMIGFSSAVMSPQSGFWNCSHVHYCHQLKLDTMQSQCSF